MKVYLERKGYSYSNTTVHKYLYEFTTEETLYQKVEEFAYVDYNHVRPHSYNGYRTPYEARTTA